MSTNDLTTKLLANEDITIVRANASTASFDVKSRVLTIPQWKNMSSELEDMLKAHEVGHALYTTGDEWIEACKEQNTLKGYINVVEDARIEKLMKRRYPGIRKTFYTGYQELIAQDFFKLVDKDVNEMLLVDRINLHYKGGVSLGVKFSDKEMDFVRRIDVVETMSEVIAIAKDLLAFTKEEMKSKKDQDKDEQALSSETDESSSGMSEEVQTEPGNSEENNELNQGLDSSNGFDNGESEEGADEISDEDLESQTDKDLNSALENMVDRETIYRFYEFNSKIGQDPVVHYKKILTETTNSELDPNFYDTRIITKRKTEFGKFMADSEKIVSYLAKEFEMRKSATAYKRAQISKSGALNCNKLYAYTLTDDIFKKITTLPNGKSHGMVFLLDWSGSMMNTLDSTIKQLINLVMFCRRVNIPFEVFAFTSEYANKNKLEELDNIKAVFRDLNRTADKNIIFSSGSFNLLNLFSSKMTTGEFNTMCRRLLNDHLSHNKGYGLGGTPLADALLNMLDYIPMFKKSNNVEKLTFITLTDGAGAPLKAVKPLTYYSYEPEMRNTKYVINTVNDPITHKSYKLDHTDFSQSQTKTLLKMIKDRYQVNIIGFFICRNSVREIDDAVRANNGARAGRLVVDAIRGDFRSQGFFSIPNSGHDELFLIPDYSTKVVDQELEVDAEASAAKIARQMGKMFNTKKHSRILLDKFIGYVA